MILKMQLPGRFDASLVALVALVLGGASFAQSACEVSHVAASDGGPFLSFGNSVGLAGDTAVIGSDWDNDNGVESGSAYIFTFNGTTWAQAQKLIPSDVQPEDSFGWATAIAGDTAMIASLQHVHSGQSGSVYVFRFDGKAWIEQQELLASDGAYGDGFGISIAIDDHTALIGASSDDDNGGESGSAYVYRFDGTSWIEQQKLVAADGSEADFFGGAVALSGQVAVIGAHCDFNELGRGAAYIFRFDEKKSAWVEEQKLLPFEPIGWSSFGQAVAANDDVVLVGATVGGPGRVYAYRFEVASTTWVGEQELVASDGLHNDKFGHAVALDGNTALVGAFANDQVGSNHGAAYLFRYDGSSWVEQETLLPAPGPWTAFFGFSVALSDGKALVGAYGENAGAGAAYMYAGLSESDCNANGIGDACDILDGTSSDLDADGVPDECACPWDLDGSGSVEITDFLGLLSQWGPCRAPCPFDTDGDGNVGVVDFLDLLAHWGPCP